MHFVKLNLYSHSYLTFSESTIHFTPQKCILLELSTILNLYENSEYPTSSTYVLKFKVCRHWVQWSHSNSAHAFNLRHFFVCDSDALSHSFSVHNIWMITYLRKYAEPKFKVNLSYIDASTFNKLYTSLHMS